MPCALRTSFSSVFRGTVLELSLLQRLVLDKRPYHSYMPESSPIEGTSTGDSRSVGRVRFPGVGLVTSIRAALGIDRPAYCRSARCSLHWRRGGSSRAPGNSRKRGPRPSRGVKPSAHDRGGRRKARAPPFRSALCGKKRWRSPDSQQALVLLRRGRIPSWCAERRPPPFFFAGRRMEGLS